jgi:hypothetical protein
VKQRGEGQRGSGERRARRWRARDAEKSGADAIPLGFVPDLSARGGG